MTFALASSSSLVQSIHETHNWRNENGSLALSSPLETSCVRRKHPLPVHEYITGTCIEPLDFLFSQSIGTTTTAQLGRCSLPLVVLAIVSSHIQANTHCVHLVRLGFFFLLFFLKSRVVNACFYHTYNSVKLAQPTSNTSTPWAMLLMKTVALFKSSNKHLVNTRRTQTYRPSQLLTKAVLESIRQTPSRTVLQAVWHLGYSAEYRQVGFQKEICASLPEQDKECTRYQ